MKCILEKTDLIVNRLQPRNLTQARYITEKPATTVTKCEESRYGTCNVLITEDSITSNNGNQWQIKSAMNCKSRNIIYAIICTKCNNLYVGQTENLRKRVTLHKEQIQHEEYRHVNASEHLATCNNGYFKIMPIYHWYYPDRLFGEAKKPRDHNPSGTRS